MAKTTTAPASAEKTLKQTSKTIKKKIDHPWKDQSIAFVGTMVYSETKDRTCIMQVDEEGTKPLIKKLCAKYSKTLSKKTQVVVLGDVSRMAKGEVCHSESWPGPARPNPPTPLHRPTPAPPHLHGSPSVHS